MNNIIEIKTNSKDLKKHKIDIVIIDIAKRTIKLPTGRKLIYGKNIMMTTEQNLKINELEDSKGKYYRVNLVYLWLKGVLKETYSLTLLNFDDKKDAKKFVKAYKDHIW